MSCLKSTTYWISLFHILHVKYRIKRPNSLSFFFIILASGLSTVHPDLSSAPTRAKTKIHSFIHSEQFITNGRDSGREYTSIYGRKARMSGRPAGRGHALWMLISLERDEQFTNGHLNTMSPSNQSCIWPVPIPTGACHGTWHVPGISIVSLFCRVFRFTISFFASPIKCYRNGLIVNRERGCLRHPLPR